MRLAVYTDYTYRQIGDEVRAERAFALFVGRLRSSFDRLVLIGRLSPSEAGGHYAVGEGVELLPLPYYPRLSSPFQALRVMGRSLIRFWRALPEFDCVWLLGPHPFAIAFALLATVRRKAVVLGVRQDTVAYVKSRHPRRVDLQLAAIAMEGAFLALARRFPVVAVGPRIARRYRRSPRPLEIAVSLVDEDDIVDPGAAIAGRSYDEELRVLTVGRLEAEKNPLLLADVLARLNGEGERRWRLLVCGEGELRDPLAGRLAEIGQADQAELLGYVPFGDPLMSLYRSSHVLLHLSLTEGLPQVLLEAFAAGLPVVATDVGGIGGALDGAAVLVPPRRPDLTAGALREVAGEAERRRQLVEAGHGYVRDHTAELEVRRVAELLGDAAR